MSFLIKYLWEERWTQHLALPNSDGQVDKKALYLYLIRVPYTRLFKSQELSCGDPDLQ
jgi:hypothetical protein